MRKTNDNWVVTAVAFILAMLTIVGVAWIRAHLEAAAFNRATGKSVTTWDALWMDLRVIGEVKQP